MQLDLDRVLGVVPTVPFTPVVADRVRENIACTRERRSRDASANLWVALETVLCVLVPEVEGAIAASGAEGAVDGVEGDCVDRVDFCDVALAGVGLAVAFEGEVKTGNAGLAVVCLCRQVGMGGLTWCLCLRRTGLHSVLQSILRRNRSRR
jgi:hypothetical protein